MDLSQFVEIRPVVMEGEPDAHNVFLVVGPQYFCLTPYGEATHEGAEAIAKMLLHALEKLVETAPPERDGDSDG